MRVRPPIVLGKLTDDCRLHLDNTVHSKLTNSGTLSKWLNHVESTISAEAAVQFCHPPPPNHNLAGQSHRTKSSINLIKEKNLLLAQIKSSPLPEQNDKSYDVFLDELEDLLPKPQVTKILRKGSFAYNDFLNLISFRRNASAPRLNEIS